MSLISELNRFADDTQAIDELMRIKYENKKALTQYIQDNYHIEINPHAIFDIQIKCLHEYKRQLLNILHILYLYHHIKTDPSFEVYPRVFIFSAKAASSYHQAKLIIKLINVVADIINNDTDIAEKIKIVFLENYNVTLAQRLIPACDVSEQISTAGYEASGTGNMKLMMNGALTLGTMDGANVEISQAVGLDNIFIFGLSAAQVKEKQATYNVTELLANNKDMSNVVHMLLEEPWTIHGYDTLRDLYDSLLHGVDGNRADKYMVLADFDSYVQIQKEVENQYQHPHVWGKKCLINIATSGRFSSDRAIKEYAQEIWHITPCLLA